MLVAALVDRAPVGRWELRFGRERPRLPLPATEAPDGGNPDLEGVCDLLLRPVATFNGLSTQPA